MEEIDHLTIPESRGYISLFIQTKERERDVINKSREENHSKQGTTYVR